MTTGPQLARLHALADAGEEEAAAAWQRAREAAVIAWAGDYEAMDAHYKRVLAGPPATREAQARVAALFGLVLLPEPGVSEQA